MIIRFSVRCSAARCIPEQETIFYVALVYQFLKMRSTYFSNGKPSPFCVTPDHPDKYVKGYTCVCGMLGGVLVNFTCSVGQIKWSPSRYTRMSWPASYLVPRILKYFDSYVPYITRWIPEHLARQMKVLVAEHSTDMCIKFSSRFSVIQNVTRPALWYSWDDWGNGDEGIALKNTTHHEESCLP